MVSWNSLAFSMMQQMLAIWSLVLLPLRNPACTFGRSQFTYYWSLAWRILSIILLTCEMRAIVLLHKECLNILWHALLWDWNENWPFPVLWPLLSFANLLTYWVQHLPALSFKILNSSAGIISPPLTSFVVIFLKANLTSHSSISSSQWVTTQLCFIQVIKNYSV